MNQCAIQQSEIGSSRGEMRSSISVSVMVVDRKETMVCPKPRRLGLLNTPFNDYRVRSPRWQLCHQAEVCDSKGGSDVLDMILMKDGSGVEQTCTDIGSSPPFFCGSPPSRVSNPLIQDARFGDEKAMTPLPPSSPSSNSRKGSCVRANFGNKPAVRVEGFDCLDRDGRNCRISALA
ncbi:hypothetical protein F3Y22_tig00110114pilonHSYRG00135 [Hibiscus syriacus]|uniref:Uncharacterized protein n=1 Tax=Hibiscus syriacus TaxID=106335 RepID=A0A6A3BM66_HIBSY|nr:uncharacterized protein LOC120215233 [Hibiscus syriacus]KAE8716498.1 hypothetical protein F3Y22_tig00110114pilonHSYRG00135 [Hibiscus syriacus]